MTIRTKHVINILSCVLHITCPIASFYASPCSWRCPIKAKEKPCSLQIGGEEKFYGPFTWGIPPLCNPPPLLVSPSPVLYFPLQIHYVAIN